MRVLRVSGGDQYQRITHAMIMLCPVNFDEANSFVQQYHRHHGRVVGAKFCIGAFDDVSQCICGVAIVGRPVARMLDDGWTLEVTRLCVGPQANPMDCVASKLYGASRRAAFALGYKRLITYTLTSERGTSLNAAGWKCLGNAGGGTWNRPQCARPRVDKHPTQLKFRWEVVA